MGRYPKHSWLTAILLITTCFAFPQTPSYTFRHLTTRDGLPSNAVRSIIRDSQGFMWFGTDGGLARYDGYHIRTFPDQNDSLASKIRDVIKIVEDRDGNLWIGTYFHGLWRFDRTTESFTGFKHDPDDPNSLSHDMITALYVDREGVLWAGTSGGGLNKYNAPANQFNTYRQEPDQTNSQKDHVTALFEDSSGSFWVGTAEGLFLFDRVKELFTPFDLQTDIPPGQYRQINCILEDRNGILWIGSNWGLFKYNSDIPQPVNYLPADILYPHSVKLSSNNYLSNLWVMSIVEGMPDGEHELWIATHWGLNRFDPDDERFEAIHENPDDPRSISASLLDELYLDDAGQLWIGTLTSGIDVMNTRVHPFKQVKQGIAQPPRGNFYISSSCFLIDHENTLWVGGIDAGIFHFDENLHFISQHIKWDFAPDVPHNNRIECIYEDAENNLWLGFWQWGFVNFDRGQKIFSHVALQNSTDIPKPTSFDNIMEDHDGILWIGTNAGLYCKDRNEPILHPVEAIEHDDLQKAEILRIYEDTKWNLWISTRNSGLYCLQPENRDSFGFVRFLDPSPDQHAFSGNHASAICEDRTGTLWFGSDKGLNTFNSTSGKFEPDKHFNSDHSGYIIQLFCDDHNNLWIFHAKEGLIRYQPSAMSDHNVKVYDVMDGLPFDHFNTKMSYTHSFYQSEDGRLFMAGGIETGTGFLWFDPDRIKDNSLIPQVVITNFRVGNRDYMLDSSISIKKHITLKYNENFFSFEFAVLDFLIPEKNQYAWFLEGLEDDWNDAGNQRSANYTGVAPGEYTFRVKGSNNDGYWNEKGTSIHISILPPFWKTWWAYGLYGLACIAVIYAIFYYYLRRQRLLHDLEIEQIEAKKLKELDSLKSRFFANISHEFRTPLTLILGPLQQLFLKTRDEQIRQDIAIMQRNAHRLQNLINQLLDLSRLESGKMELHAAEENIVSLVKSYVQQFESLARQKGIELLFSSEQDDIPALVDRDKIERILFNLLGNAFKWTKEGGRIEVTVGILSAPPAVPPKSGGTKWESSPPNRGDRGGARKGECVVISISDTGIGIPVDKLPHIFDRFYQAGDSYTEGTGIGLALTKELVELHGGTITVESVVNQGSVFRVFLPVGKEFLRGERRKERGERRDRRVGKEEGEGIERSNIEHRQLTIDDSKHATCNLKPATDSIPKEAPLLLIVEDNADLRLYLKGLLEKDYQILEAGDGRQGLAKALEQVPDLVLTDVMMPEMDGYELSRKLKTDERTSHIPVILLTARASRESRIEGLETGADDFVTKPFDAEELLVRIRNLIDQRKKLRERYIKDFEVIKAESKGQPLSLDEKFLQKARSVVMKNLADPEYGVERFASDMAMSRVQLHRKLRALIDQPVTEFIRTIRLNYAAGLLQKKAGTISEIAYDAGFNNPTWFTISFKKKFGISPSDYLDQLEKK